MGIFCLLFLSFILYKSKHHCYATETVQSKLMESRNLIEDGTVRDITSQQFARKDGLMTHQDYSDRRMTNETILQFLHIEFTHFTKRISKIFSGNNNFVVYRKTVLHRSQGVLWRDSDKFLQQKVRDKRNTKTDAYNFLLQKQSGGKTVPQIPQAVPHTTSLKQESSHVNASHENATVSSARNITDLRTSLQINWNRSEQTTNATVCLSVLLLLLFFVVYRSKMWREKDDYWDYLAAPDSRFHLDDDWTYNRHKRPRLNISLKEMLKSKVQALQTLFQKTKRRRGKYTRLTNIDEQDSEDELFTQPV